MKVIEERQKHDFDKWKEKHLENKSRNSVSVIETSSTKPRVKPGKVTREDRKKKGDSYLKDIIEVNKQKRKKSPKLESKTQVELAHMKTIE